jgi:hypothetical protein
MSLTKDEVAEMVQAVANDNESVRRIHEGTVVADILPDAIGLNGSVRNWGYVACGMVTFGKACSPLNEEYANKVCTGISSATADAISAAVQCRVALVSRVAKVTTISRVGFLGTDHTATHIFMTDGTEYVLDFHATLNSRNPMVHKAADWRNSTGGVTFKSFTGFADTAEPAAPTK